MKIDKKIIKAVESVTRHYYSDRNKADEAAANTYLYLLKRKTPINYISLVKQKAKNHCIDLYRRTKREVLIAEFKGVYYDNPLDSIIEKEQQKIEKERIKQAVDKLPAIWYDVIILRYWGKCTCPEIAAKLNIKLGTVKSRLSRAEQLLKEIYV